jgi:hypothetical protein
MVKFRAFGVYWKGSEFDAGSWFVTWSVSAPLSCADPFCPTKLHLEVGQAARERVFGCVSLLFDAPRRHVAQRT